MSDPGAGPPVDEQLLTVTRRVRDGGVVVTAVGEVDAMTAARFRAAIDEAFRAEAAGPVVVDLLGVTFLDSAGLKALVWAAKRAEALGRRFRIVVNEHRPVRHPIRVTGLDSWFTLCDTVAEALTR